MATKSTTKKTITSKSSSTTKSPTVSYNPKTGAKLKTGESVSYNGKTYTQGSAAIGGVSSSKPITKATLSPSKSSNGTKSGVFKQTMTPKVSSTPTKSTTPKVTTTTPNAINSSKSNVIKYPTVAVPSAKAKSFGNPFAGGFLNNVVQGAKTTFSGAKEKVKAFGDTLNTAIGKDRGMFAASAAPISQKVNNPVELQSKVVVPKQTGLDYSQNEQNVGIIQSSRQNQREQTRMMQNEDREQGIVNNFLTETGQAVTRPVMTSGGSGMQRIGSGGSPRGSVLGASTSALSTPSTTETTTRTNPDGSTTKITSSSSESSAPVVYNPSTVASAANTISVLTDNINKSKNDPYNKYNQKGDMIKYTDTALSNLAGLYSDPSKVLSDYNTVPEFKAQVDQFTKMTGKTVNDIAAKVQPVNNGITQPQTTAEYLANNTAISGVDKGMKDILTEEQKFNAQRVQAMNAELETQKTEAKSLIEFYEKQEQNREKSEREKAQFAIDKAKAEFDAADAETEQQRILATDNLKNFLAKIGALNTDAMSGVGLANLEQRYQAQRAALRSNFQLAKREIEINMNDRLNALEEARDEKVFKLNQDLSKSEREIALDVMKLNHDLNKDILKAKYEYSERIRKERKDASDKAAAALKGWEAAFFDTAATADYFDSLPAEFKASWKANNVAPTDGTRTTLSGAKGLNQDFAAFEKNRAASQPVTNVEIQQTINRQIGTPEWKSASKEEKTAYIRALGADPSDYEL